MSHLRYDGNLKWTALVIQTDTHTSWETTDLPQCMIIAYGLWDCTMFCFSLMCIEAITFIFCFSFLMYLGTFCSYSCCSKRQNFVGVSVLSLMLFFPYFLTQRTSELSFFQGLEAYSLMMPYQGMGKSIRFYYFWVHF